MLQRFPFTSNNNLPVLIQEELEFDIEVLRRVVEERQNKFTDSQRKVFDTVMKAVEVKEPLCVFVDARGGTG